MRLYDRMIWDGVVLPPEAEAAGWGNALDGTLPTATVFAIDEPFAHLVAMGEQTRRALFWETLPPVVPPFPACFVEWRTPDACGDWFLWEEHRTRGLLESGWLVRCGETPEPAPGGRIPSFDARDGDEADAVVPRWLVSAALFTRVRGRPHPRGPSLEVRLFLDDDGCISWTHGRKRVQVRFFPRADADGPRDVDVRDLGAFVHDQFVPVLFAFSLANCRNTTLIEHEGRHESRQARRLAERQGKPGPTRFYTLEIGPATGRPAAEPGPNGKHRDRALHIVRGHFATYTTERPLFGKLVGTWYWHPHVRGTAEVGTVAKDYAVAAPPAANALSPEPSS